MSSATCVKTSGGGPGSHFKPCYDYFPDFTDWIRMRGYRNRISLGLYGLGLLAAVLVASAVHALDRTVARITDIQGVAALIDGDEPENLRILTRLRSGNRIRLEAGASVTMHFPASRTDFRFSGPDTIRVEDQRAVGESATPEIRVHSDIGVNLDLTDTDLGAIAMRSIKPESNGLKVLGPSDTRVLLGKPVTFRWQAPEEAGIYNIALKSASGQNLFNQTTAATSLVLPPDISLVPGGRYQWQVYAMGNDGMRLSAEAEFSAAPADVEARYYRIAVLTSGNVSDLVLHGLYLEQMALHEEAEKSWQYLETLRPGIRSELGKRQ